MARKNTLCKVITLPDGKRKWIYAKTQEELNKKIFDLQLQIGLGVDLSNNDTFGEYALLWYKTYKAPFVRENTKRFFLNALNNHILPKISGYKMRDITPLHIQMVFNSISGQSASLNNSVKLTLNGIFNTAVENNVIVRSPMVKSLRINGAKPEEKEALTPDEATQLLDALSGSTIRGVQQCHLFCHLALKSGLRRGELCGLMWSDIDLTKGELTVLHNCTWPNNTSLEISTNLKTDAAKRTVPLPATVVAELKSHRSKSQSLYVFSRQSGEPMTQSAFRRMWTHASRALQGIAAASPHILRHTYCTRLFEAGLDIKEIQYLMGHASPDMTMQIYTHYSKKSRFSTTAEKVRAAL